MMLSILICTLPDRKEMFDGLLTVLTKQATDEVELLYDRSVGVSTGAKRNTLLQHAQGDYVCFIDDDDMVCEKYVPTILSALCTLPDCCSLNGIMTTNGRDTKKFVHSIDHKKYFEKEGVYYRPPNHLNVIKRSIAQQFVFPDVSYGEDTDWAMLLCHSGLLRVEYKIPQSLYHYRYVSEKLKIKN